MRLLSEILGSFMGAGLIILIIVFQQEIRKFLLVIGSATFSRRKGIRNMLNMSTTEGTDKRTIDAIVGAAAAFAEDKVGALIVIERKDPLGSFAGTGHHINGALSRILLESIFFKNAPLHDGATIVSKNKVIAAGAVLPLSESSDLPSKFGLRHRAAAGISERTDALALAVSEENGKIHVFYEGEFELVSQEELSAKMAQLIQG